MTEISKEIGRPGQLPIAVERFILYWGDMGSQWGVNRTVAQIHALLYVSERPLTAEEIAAALGVARSELLFVGDSLKDGELAAAARVDFVGRLGTFGAEDFLRHHPRARTIADVGELPSLFAAAAAAA